MAFEKVDHHVTADDDGTRLDRFIRRLHPDVNQGRIEKLLRGGVIRLDGLKAKSSARLYTGAVVTMPRKIEPAPASATATAQATPKARKPAVKADPKVVATVKSAVIGKGKGWIALNKPSGLATQGGSGTRHHVDGALAEAFADHEKCRLVHRLDRDTSGVLVIATDLSTARNLANGFQRHDHDKTYLALLQGVPKISMGKINAPLLKAGGKGHERMVVDDDGQPAVTLYRVLEQMGKSVSLVALRPKTGRTHQLRAHMAELGCPILGDGKYGGAEAFPNDAVTRLCLHAASLTLDATGRGGSSQKKVTAPIPDDMVKVFDFFGLDAASALRSAADPDCFEDN
ncbi:MAG: RluA family pseudouridine synthase [Alphaproteobacteria bacterium]|nr:RluA family pseudouridine synthase [Alphaproteobacteria bacterium]